jgi:hypothetical protein
VRWDRLERERRDRGWRADRGGAVVFFMNQMTGWATAH